jgi:acyl transferase domain-containing protein/acyl-CoA synthetase (AMP-forming)/AMP-acid ligase II/acyl carrier protein
VFEGYPINNLVELIRYRAAQSPDQMAYTYLKEGIVDEGRLNYAELDRKARAGAVVIRRCVAPNGRVLLLYPPGIDFMVGFAACLYAGVIPIPAPPPDTVRLKRTLPRLKAIAKDAEASLVLSSGELIESIKQKSVSATQAAMETFAVEHWLDYSDLNQASADDWRMPEITGDNLAYLQYTSGSTATPKGVMMSHANLMHHLAQIQQAWGYDKNSVSVTWMPYFHDYGLVDGLLEPLFTGIPCYILSPLTFLKRPLRWLQAISKYRGTHTQAPNFAYAYCLEKISDEQLKELNLSCLKVASNGAEPVRWATVNAFSKRFAACGFRAERLYPAYGLAEATLLVATKPHDVLPRYHELSVEQRRDDNIQGAIVSCGPPIGVTEVKIVKPETSTVCEPGDIGEIWIKDIGVAQGYWHNPQATQETFHAYTDDGEGLYLRSGDLGFLHDGELFITGRLKDLIIINGVNHYPQDIEWTVIQAHSALRPEHAAAFSVTVDNQERAVVVAELNQSSDDNQLIVQAIRTALAEVHELDVYAVALLKKGTILKTSSGKLQRHACKQAFLAARLDTHTVWQQPSAVKLSTVSAATLVDWLVAELAQALAIAPESIDVNQVFSAYGLSSRLAVSLVGELEDFLATNSGMAVELSPTLLWQYPTVATLAAFVETQLQSVGGAIRPTQDHHRLEQSPIAVVGMGCRFPDADNPDEFWQHLVDGHDAIKDIPVQRWDVDSYPQINTRRAGLLKHVDLFDADFFGIAGKEADAMDPQQRLVLEVAYEALEYAGIAPESLAESETGVFIGISTDDYAAWQLSAMEAIDAYASTGKTFSIVANRLSYLLDLRGPSLAIDTACSSSLVAVHQACQSLRQQECSLALAGGVNLVLSPQLMVALSAANMLAPDGQCKTFADDANGYVRGEGCGVVVLKRLVDAERDGDPVLAVIRGSAVNQDGRSNGLTAPNLNAQQSVIKKALANAQVKAEAVSYIEAHGTGTPLGDPIEMDALLSVFRQTPELNVGSVKTNIGHLEAAAGIAGLIKVIQSLRHQTIPAHLHCRTRNPLIKLDGTGFSIPIKTQPWLVEQRIAGVSSFGFGGTNAHIVVAEAKRPELPTENKTAQMLMLSAKSSDALQQLLQRYSEFIRREPQLNLADLCYSAALGRSDFNYRSAIVADTSSALVEALQTEALKTFTATLKTARKIAFLYTGQGAQTRQMGLQLYRTEAVFKAAIDTCALLLADELALPLMEVMFDDDDRLLNQTGYTQPLLFSLQYALAKLWQSWGIKPDVLLGHSVGEYAVACLSGIFDLPDAVKLIAARGRLMQALPANGGMAAVFAEVGAIEAAIAKVSGLVVIAGFNSPSLQVISGENGAVAAVCETLREQGVSSQPLTVSHAFHSPLMHDMLAEFAEVAQSCRYYQPNIAIVSSLTGKRIDMEMSSPDYWVAHITEPVRFSGAVAALLAETCDIAIEIGPQPHASAMAQQASGAETVQWLPSLKRGVGDRDVLLSTVAKLYQLGVNIDRYSMYSGLAHRRLIGLPSYPFQRQRYWLDTQPTFSQDSAVCRLSKSAAPASQLYYRWHWQPEPLLSTGVFDPQTWLIFADRSGIAASLAQQLTAVGHNCQLVFPGPDNRPLTQQSGWQITADTSGLRYLQERQLPVARIVHLWSLELSADLQADTVMQQQAVSCFSVMHILQQLPVHSLWLVTRQAYALNHDDSVQPNQAPLWGMAKAIALEYPTVFRGMIDIASDRELAPLAAELNAKGAGLAVALRDKQRYAGRLLPYELAQASKASGLIKAEGTYLITGGLGALGMQITQRLAELGAKTIVLLARRKVTEELLAALDVLSGLGCRVHTLQADVASRTEMQIVADKLKQLPPLLGIIHAAGVATDKSLAKLSEDDFSQALSAKVQGACLLHQLSLDLELDFFCLMSSIASVWGAKERGHYAAANQFLDALSAYRHQQGLPAISLNFGPWQGEGMASGLGEELAQSGIRPLNPEQVLSALPQILSEPAAQIIVADADWTLLSVLFSGYAGADLFEHLITTADKPGAAVPVDRFLEQLLGAPKDRQQALLSERLQAELGLALGLKKSKALDPERGFFEMGMDSLMAVQFRLRLESLFGLQLPTTLAFDYPNIQHLSAFLAAELLYGQTAKIDPSEISDQDQLASAIDFELTALENLLREHA